MHIGAMPELLTTDEAAEYLRLSERKLYELVAERAVPCSKVTGSPRSPRPLGLRRPDRARRAGAGGGAADRRRQP